MQGVQTMQALQAVPAAQAVPAVQVASYAELTLANLQAAWRMEAEQAWHAHYMHMCMHM